MQYAFNILGVSPILSFFSQQQQIIHTQPDRGVEYLGARKCTIDEFIASIDELPQKHGWDINDVTNTMIQFWIDNADSIDYWKSRLADAGKDNLLIARLANLQGLQQEFEYLLDRPNEL
jgi:hypothetical protein